MSHIVVGVDGSEQSRAALAWAVAEARLRRVTVGAVNAYVLPAGVVGMGEALGASVASPIAEHDMAAHAQAILADALEATDHDGVELTSSTRRGSPAQVLVEASVHADLLVLGAGHREGQRLGSVGAHCLSHAACPVVVVRSPSEESRSAQAWPPPSGGTWVLDLDGVVWLNAEPIVGSAEGVAALRARGSRVLFCTNNSSLTVAEVCRRLERVGIDAVPGDVVSSAQAAAAMVAPDASALVLAGEGVREALGERGIRVVNGEEPETVVVGWTRDFDFDALAGAAAAVRAGARLIGTNEDATYPTPEGLVPGGGSILAAVATASGARPEVAGKPHRPLVDLLRRRAGDVVAVVGDRPSTDGLLARALGVPFALVLSGVTSASDHPDPRPAVVAPDLGVLVADLGR